MSKGMISWAAHNLLFICIEYHKDDEISSMESTNGMAWVKFYCFFESIG